MRRPLLASVPSLAALLLAAASSVALFAAPLAAQTFKPGYLFAVSGAGDRVMVFDGSQAFIDELTAGAALAAPRALAFGPDGRLYVTSQDNGSVLVFNAAGLNVGAIPIGDTGSDPTALAFGPDGQLCVVDAATDKLFACNTAGAPLGSIDLPAGEYETTSLVFGADGHLFLTDPATGNVLEVDRGGTLIRALGAGALASPAGLAFGPDGLLRVAVTGAVVVLDTDGTIADTITGAALSGSGSLAFGPDGHLFACTSGSANNIVEFNAAGTQVKAFGANDGLSAPGAIAFAPWRLKAAIKGSLARPDLPLQNVKEGNAVLSVLPGSHTLMLAFTDDVSNPADLASVFSTSYLVLHGFEGSEDNGATTRLFHGAQVAGPAQQDGVASLILRVKGSLKSGAFITKKAEGVLQRAGAAGVYTATLKTGSLLK